MKPSAKSSKTTKSVKPARNNKDGYGAHWHSVGWIAAVAVVLSAATMTLGASAATPNGSESVLLKHVRELRMQLDRVEQKIDRIESSVNGS